MTRDEFIRDMKKGWEKLDYTAGVFYRDRSGSVRNRNNSGTVAACAIGAAAYGAGFEFAADYMADTVPGKLWDMIADASNNAGSKEAAIAAVEALDWPETPASTT